MIPKSWDHWKDYFSYAWYEDKYKDSYKSYMYMHDLYAVKPKDNSEENWN